MELPLVVDQRGADRIEYAFGSSRECRRALSSQLPSSFRRAGAVSARIVARLLLV